VRNTEIAGRFEEVAALLRSQGADPHRAGAYERAARTLRLITHPVEDIYRAEGVAGLDSLPGIGRRLSYAIRDLILTGRLPILERLRGEGDPVRLLTTVPGIGPVTAARLHDDLGVGSLYDLETAAHDGRLARVPGMGKKRLAGVIDSLSTRLGRLRPGPAPLSSSEPSVAELLDVDRQYRESAKAGTLQRIAPRRFNPEGKAWLPVLHTTRGSRHYTALFSNTARARQMGATGDWVVLYADGGAGERQWTVITSRRGILSGKRIVQGREPECEEYYFGSEALAS
jgi:DNA polymerase (family 10)